MASKHLVDVIDLILSPNGPYLVTEWIEGPSLAHIIRDLNTPMDVHQAMGILAAAAQGFMALHDAGLVHGRLKPDNILMPRAGGLKITDFAYAQLADHHIALDESTVPMLSPHRLTGHAPNAADDLYALGMIAYQMMAGRPSYAMVFNDLFKNPGELTTRWAIWHMNPQAAPPSLDTLREDVSPEVARIITHLMIKNPDSRIESADSLLQSIQRCINDEPDPPLEALQQASRPNAVVGPTTTIARGPITLTIVIALIAILGTLAWAWHINTQTTTVRAAREKALVVFEQSQATYARGDFREARDRFEQLSITWGDDPQLGPDTRAHARLADAQIAIQRGDYDTARAALIAVQSITRNGKPVIANTDVNALLDIAQENQGFASEIKTISDMIDQAQFDQARDALRQRWTSARTDAQKTELDRLGERLEDQQARQRVANALAQAEKHIAADQHAQAIALLESIRAEHPSDLLDEHIERYRLQQTQAVLIAEAQSAIDTDDFDAAIAAYDKAIMIRPNPALQRRANELKAQRALRKGKAALEIGDHTTAEAALVQSLGYQETEAARSALSQIKSQGRRAAFIAAGDQAMADKHFEAAVGSYRSAQALSETPDVAGKLNLALVRRFITACEQRIDQGKLADAEKAFALAAEVDPQHALVTAMRTRLDDQRDYLILLEAGDKLRAQSQFGEAKRAYQRAAQLSNTPTVQARIKSTEYESLIAKARRDIESKQFDSARAWLTTAAKIRPTDEIDKLLADIDRRSPKP